MFPYSLAQPALRSLYLQTAGWPNITSSDFRPSSLAHFHITLFMMHTYVYPLHSPHPTEGNLCLQSDFITGKTVVPKFQVCFPPRNKPRGVNSHRVIFCAGGYVHCSTTTQTHIIKVQTDAIKYIMGILYFLPQFLQFHKYQNPVYMSILQHRTTIQFQKEQAFQRSNPKV